MNCPSRTDDTLLHDEWNQNPPLLAPDLTTRQDLNGIANARENKDDEHGPAGPQGCSNWSHISPLEESDTENYLGAGRGVSLTLSGMNSHYVTGRDFVSDQANRTPRFHQRQRSSWPGNPIFEPHFPILPAHQRLGAMALLGALCLGTYLV